MNACFTPSGKSQIYAPTVICVDRRKSAAKVLLPRCSSVLSVVNDFSDDGADCGPAAEDARVAAFPFLVNGADGEDGDGINVEAKGGLVVEIDGEGVVVGRGCRTQCFPPCVLSSAGTPRGVRRPCGWRILRVIGVAAACAAWLAILAIEQPPGAVRRKTQSPVRVGS
jgi:hypothetical protein